MKISLNWIRDYVALDAPVAEITRAITFLGFEVEHVAVDRRAPAGAGRRRRGADPREAPERRQALRLHGRHRAGRRREDDRLRRPELQGGRPRPGGASRAPSCRATSGSSSRRSAAQLSDGMMCSGKELGMGDDQAGLLILAGRPRARRPDQRRPAARRHGVRRRDHAQPPGLPLPPRARARAGRLVPQGPHLSRRRSSGATSPDGGRAASSSAGVSVEAPEDCPLYSAHVVAGVQGRPEPRRGCRSACGPSACARSTTSSMSATT